MVTSCLSVAPDGPEGDVKNQDGIVKELGRFGWEMVMEFLLNRVSIILREQKNFKIEDELIKQNQA